MAIRWSAKGKRFYDDTTGYPVSRTSGFRSSMGRDTFAHAHRRRKKYKKRKRHPAVPEEYEVRPLSEEFAEEYEEYDGTISKEMSLEAYAAMLGEEEPEALEQEDRYSED